MKTDATPIQARNSFWFPQDKTSGNTALCLLAFATKSLTSAETSYINIEREGLCTLQSLEKFQHYFFTAKVGMTTDHKPLVVIFRKDVATISQSLQQILLCIH